MGSCTGIDVSITDSSVYTGHSDGQVRVWSFKSKQQIRKLNDLHYDAITSIKASNCGSYILTNSMDSRM